MWQEMLQGWIDLARGLTRFLVVLLAKCGLVAFVAITTYKLLTR